MKRSEAARYARLSAIAAFSLAAITSGMYIHRQWVAHEEKKHAPPAPPKDVERLSSSLTFSKVETTRTIFTVQASKSTDLKGQDISLLEDVRITAYGKSGDRNDVIHTQSCKYAKADGAIQCSGSVVMDLQSAVDAERARKAPNAPANVIHVETSAVTFERASGRAQTVEPVKFSFPNGNGEGVGAVYLSGDGQLKLVKDVRITIQPTEPTGPEKKKVLAATEVVLHGSNLEMGKQSRKVVLNGPTTAATSAQELTAGELTLLLDREFRAQTLIAARGSLGELPQVISHGAKETSKLSAEKLTANLVPEGWIQTIEAEGNVQCSSPRGELQAERGVVEMWPRVNQAKFVTLSGNVRVASHDPQSGNTRKLATRMLQLSFTGAQAGEANHVEHAETLARGTLEWVEAAAQTRLAGDKLALDFSAAAKARQLNATGNVQTEREIKDRPLQTATAATGEAQMDATGAWTQMTLQGNVHMKEGDRSAESQRAVFVKAAQTSVLTGDAVARDAGSETRATKITFHQGSGDFEAEGKVRSTDFSAKTSTVQLGQAASNISSERMQGNSKSGRAVYTGHARLWQGPSVLEADSIELLRESRVLNALGNVRAAFPQSSQENRKAKQAAIWHVSSGTLTFWDNENRAHLEKNVVVQSTDQRMRAPVLDLYFTREASGKPGSEGAEQISRAAGTGGVVVEQGDRRGTAERGVYTAADQRFVLSGGNPTLYDATEGTTTGRELTFNIADDTIIVDSGNGMRTLTKHRVQR